LKFAGGTLQATTDATGIASFDLAGVRVPSGIDRDTTAQMLIASANVGQVDLAKLTIFPEWVARLERKREVAQAAQKMEEEKQEAAQKMEEAARKEEQSARRKQIAKWHVVAPDAVMHLMHDYIDLARNNADSALFALSLAANGKGRLVMGVMFGVCDTPSRECVESALEQFPNDLVLIDGEIRNSPELEKFRRHIAESIRKLRPKWHAECVHSCLADSTISITRDQCEAKCD
jgi:hypothetical protein